MENQKLFEFMEKMYADLKGGQEKMYADLKGSQEKMYTELLDGQSRLETRMTGLEAEVKKNSVKLESIENKIDIIAEVQTAHKEQSDMAFRNADALISERFDLIETALKSTSRDLQEVKDDLEFLAYKENITEKEVFTIRKRLEIIK